MPLTPEDQAILDGFADRVLQIRTRDDAASAATEPVPGDEVARDIAALEEAAAQDRTEYLAALLAIARRVGPLLLA